ncbi:unnamed protein product, partial [Adineta ricciae]
KEKIAFSSDCFDIKECSIVLQ